MTTRTRGTGARGSDRESPRTHAPAPVHLLAERAEGAPPCNSRSAGAFAAAVRGTSLALSAVLLMGLAGSMFVDFGPRHPSFLDLPDGVLGILAAPSDGPDDTAEAPLTPVLHRVRPEPVGSATPAAPEDGTGSVLVIGAAQDHAGAAVMTEVREPEAATSASGTVELTLLPGCSEELPGPADMRGESNGELEGEWLCEIGVGGFELRPDAAIAFAAMNEAYRRETGEDLAITGTYRPLERQVSIAAERPGLAAKPGSSMHGWGIAIDFGGGTTTASGPQYAWLVEHAGEFGWENPDWAKVDKYEPWHWEYVPARKALDGY